MLTSVAVLMHRISLLSQGNWWIRSNFSVFGFRVVSIESCSFVLHCADVCSEILAGIPTDNEMQKSIDLRFQGQFYLAVASMLIFAFMLRQLYLIYLLLLLEASIARKRMWFLHSIAPKYFHLSLPRKIQGFISFNKCVYVLTFLVFIVATWRRDFY